MNVEQEIIKDYPLISVIVPVYKAEKYIHRCVDSILQQTYKNLEIILVDDGSPDLSGEICDEYAKIDSRIKVIHKKNEGVSDTRNVGIRFAKGDYIAFVDSDDYIKKNMYEIMLLELMRSKVDICVCQWQYEYSDGRQVIDFNKINSNMYGKKTSVEFAEFLYKGKYENSTVCVVWNKLYKSRIFNELIFIGTYAEDERIHNRILSDNYSILVIKDQLYIYCQNNESLTNKSFKKDNLLFLDILIERISYFSNNKYILNNTRRLYCNLYIEYFFKSKKYNIEMEDMKDFSNVVTSLLFDNQANLKFIIRMIIFRISPKLYALICNIK